MRNRVLERLIETGVFIGLALALGSLRVFQMPSGGSVSLGPLPLLVLAARHGAAQGVAGGVIYGLLSLARQPTIVHPLQFLLDYPLAFGQLGLAGLLPWASRGRLVAGTVVAGSLRFACHALAGAVFFARPEDPWGAALAVSGVYNLSYLLPETALCLWLLLVIQARHPTLVQRLPEKNSPPPSPR